jgi:hypothetical protein
MAAGGQRRGWGGGPVVQQGVAELRAAGGCWVGLEGVVLRKRLCMMRRSRRGGGGGGEANR